MPKINWKSIWKVALIGAVTFVFEVTVIIFSQQNNVLFIMFSSIAMFFIALAVVQLSWNGLEKAGRVFYQWRISPKIKHWFTLPKENELKLYIHNPKGAKNVHLECRYEKYTDIRGRDYLAEYHHELKLAAPSYGANPPIFSDTLVSNDTRGVSIGISHHGKVALYFGDAPVYNFRDGTFEYIISCIAKYPNRYLRLPSFRIWLVIKDGVLVGIRDEL